jgi:hypothetical protein
MRSIFSAITVCLATILSLFTFARPASGQG